MAKFPNGIGSKYLLENCDLNETQKKFVETLGVM